MWLLEAQAHHAEGGCFVLTNQPFISGRPSKAAALQRLIEDVQALDRMWVATLEEIAQHTASVVLESREVRRITVPDGYADHRTPVSDVAPDLATA
jgi:peptidoglycan-N-acetylglucosamine deacetylase